MSVKPKHLRNGAKLVEELDDLLPRGYDVGEILLALGMKYETALKNLRRAQRLDLADKAMQWREQDLDRLRRATGKAWW